MILPVRDAKKGKLVKEEIAAYIADIPNHGSVKVVPEVDFQNFETIRAFAKRIGDTSIDILVNNAGMMNLEVGKTVDGNEQVFQVNHLAPFLLTHLLLPSMAPKSRVVFVSSAMQYLSKGITPEGYSVEARGLTNHTRSGVDRYDDSKLMNTMCAMSFQERYGKLGITFTSLNPGYAVSNLDDNMGAFKKFALAFRQAVARSTYQGAITQITVATHPKLSAGGRFYSDHCINTLCNKDCFYCDKENAPGVVPHKQALDKNVRDWLWKVSSELTGVQ